MKISPLQLTEYFVTEFHFTLNTAFKVEEPLQLKLEELAVTKECKRAPDNLRRWVVTIELKYQPAAETNTPYIFSLGLIGMFEVSPKYEESRIELLVNTNGPSVLFGMAREIVREQTARGPEGPFILPCASFLPDEPAPAETPTAPAESVTPAAPPAFRKARLRRKVDPNV